MSSFKLFGLGLKSLALSSIIALTSVTHLGSAAHAQTGVLSQRVPYDRTLITRLPSSIEDVGIAFLKTADNFPDFNKVVEESDSYKNLSPLAQQDYLAKTVNRLQNNFMAFQPKKTDLIIRVKVNMIFQKLENGESVLKLRTFPTDPIYFPFYFAKYPIAVIIKDMESFREMRLSKEDTDIVYSRLSLSGDATLLLQLYPIAANDTKPVILDNIPQFPLLTEIGYIGLLNARTEQIWAWKNDKYGDKKAIGVNSLLNLVPASKTPVPPPQSAK